MSKKKDQEEVSEGSQNASAAGGNPAAEDETAKKRHSDRARMRPARGKLRPGRAGQPRGPCGSAEDRIAVLEAEVADLKDKLLRKQADFENFRKGSSVSGRMPPAIPMPPCSPTSSA